MTTTAMPVVEGERRFLLPGVGWSGYEALLEVLAEQPVRLAYDRGDVELMSPLIVHERYRALLGRLVEILTEELDRPAVAAGSTTFRSRALDRGIEPDACYYLDSAPRLRRGAELDLDIDPPPDLAIEIEITASALQRMAIYAALGVPEVWRHDGEALAFHVLQPDGTCRVAESSRSFDGLRAADVAALVGPAADMVDDTAWSRRARAWVREHVIGRTG